jgi:hypothetical protein
MLQIPRQILGGAKQAFSNLTGQALTPQQKADTIKKAFIVALDYAMSPNTPNAGQGGRTQALNAMSEYLKKPPEEQEQIYNAVSTQPGISVQYITGAGTISGGAGTPTPISMPPQTVQPTGTVSPMGPPQAGSQRQGPDVGEFGDVWNKPQRLEESQDVWNPAQPMGQSATQNQKIGQSGTQQKMGQSATQSGLKAVPHQYANRIYGPGGEAPQQPGPIQQPTPISAMQPPPAGQTKPNDPAMVDYANKLKNGEINPQQIPKYLSKLLLDGRYLTPEEWQNLFGNVGGMGAMQQAGFQGGQGTPRRVSLDDVRNFFNRGR